MIPAWLYLVLFVCTSSLGSTFASSEVKIKSRSSGASYNAQADAALEHPQPNCIDKEQDSLQRKAESFLRQYMPPRDTRFVTAELLKQNVHLSIKARTATAWASAVPLELWLNYVTPYACMNEERSEWRQNFSSVLQPLVQHAQSLTEAVFIINQRLWPIYKVHFEPDQTPAIMSPQQVWTAGHASCTGLSIFLVSALRAVGVPARVAGTAEWNTATGGNHDWVEVWDSNVWSFTGPAEYTPKGLNVTWFYPEPARQQVKGSRKHGIYATSWQPTPDGHFPLQWAQEDHSVHGLDVTDNYLNKQTMGMHISHDEFVSLNIIEI